MTPIHYSNRSPFSPIIAALSPMILLRLARKFADVIIGKSPAQPVQPMPEVRPLIRFSNAWEGVYLPLFEKLERCGFDSAASDWTGQISQLLKRYELWYEGGSFHIDHKGSVTGWKDSRETLFAFVSLALSCKESPQIGAIYSLFIKPFRTRVPAEVYRAYYGQIQVALFRAVNGRGQGTFDDIPFQDKENRAAVLIQRVLRAHRYRVGSCNLRAEEVQYSLQLPKPQVPQHPKTVEPVSAQRWVQAHPREWQGTARKVIQVLAYRSFEKFKQRLELAVRSFNEKLMSLPVEKRKYVVVVPESRQTRSNGWVTALALPLLAVKPVDVLLSSQLEAFKKEHPDLAGVAYFDDAAFSGKQLDSLVKTLGLSCYLIIPFMTQVSINRMRGNRIWFARHETMLGLTELATFSDKELEQMKRRTGDYWDPNCLEHRSLTWFDHKIADYLSTLESVLKWGIGLVGGARIPFIRDPEFSYFNAS